MDYDASEVQTIIFMGPHESLGQSETAARNFAAWCTGLLDYSDMSADSPFTILVSMDLANNMEPGCGAYGAESCNCTTERCD